MKPTPLFSAKMWFTPPPLAHSGFATAPPPFQHIGGTLKLVSAYRGYVETSFNVVQPPPPGTLKLETTLYVRCKLEKTVLSYLA